MNTLRDLLEGSFRQNKSNGSGYELFLPKKPQAFSEVSERLSDAILFSEVPKIVGGLHTAVNNALLVSGEPGSGKSHLRDDITMAKAAMHNVPYLMASLHINGGRKNGYESIRRQITKLRKDGGENPLIVFDNIDYAGYKGKSRTRSSAQAYAQGMSRIVEEVVENDAFTVLGLAHDEEWRRGKWTWDDPEVDRPAYDILHNFVNGYRFQGDLTDQGLAEVARIRGLGSDFIDTLAKDGMQNFFCARHLDFHLYEQNPEAALLAIQQGRDARKGTLD